MRILLTADAVGGVFTYAFELAAALLRAGAEVVLATEGAPLAPDQRAAVAGIPGLVHHGTAHRLEWMPEPWDDVAAAGRWLLALEGRERPDVVHLDAYAHGALPFEAPKVVVGHSCVLSWFEAVRGVPAPEREWRRYREAVTAGLRGADAVVAPTAAMLRALRRHYGPLPPARVIPNGRDPERFRPGPKERVILAAGRVWDEAKDAAAVARVAPRVPWPVLIAGEREEPGRGAGARGGAASSASGEDGPPPGARPVPGAPAFLGRLPAPALAAWLARAAIFAHPARYEPFGLAVLEAALSGCALVLGDVASLRENWDGAAVFTPPGDDDALAARLAALARNEGLRAVLSARARARALALGPDRMAAAYLDLYRTLLLARRRAPAEPTA